MENNREWLSMNEYHEDGFDFHVTVLDNESRHDATKKYKIEEFVTNALVSLAMKDPSVRNKMRGKIVVYYASTSSPPFQQGVVFNLTVPDPTGNRILPHAYQLAVDAYGDVAMRQLTEDL